MAPTPRGIDHIVERAGALTDQSPAYHERVNVRRIIQRVSAFTRLHFQKWNSAVGLVGWQLHNLGLDFGGTVAMPTHGKAGLPAQLAGLAFLRSQRRIASSQAETMRLAYDRA